MIKPNRLLLLFALGFTRYQSQNQLESAEKKPFIPVELHARVDTTNKEVKEIATLWSNYLNARPDSVYDNPYWNTAEKRTFQPADLSIPYFYQFPSQYLLNEFRPTILSIEKEAAHYAIRCIFSADGLEGLYRKSNPWCITKLYAIKVEGNWKLKNALPILTEKWKRTRVGKITFIYPAQHTFNLDLAKKANHFCEDISKKFDFPDCQAFDFYITDSGDQMGQLLNFDFYAAGYTTGIGLNVNRILLSGKGSEYYPHEFVHLLLPKHNRHGMIEEGFATWLGGQNGKTFEQSARFFANALAKNDTVSFSDVVTKKWGLSSAAYYTSGAILCQAAYQKGGLPLLKKLLMVPKDPMKFVENLSLLFEMDTKYFDAFWRKETFKFKESAGH